MEFCPVCKKLLQVKNENGKNIGFCSCGFKRMSGIEITSSEKGNNKVISTGEGVIEEKEDEIKIEKLSYEDKKAMKPDFWKKKLLKTKDYFNLI